MKQPIIINIENLVINIDGKPIKKEIDQEKIKEVLTKSILDMMKQPSVIS